MRMRMRASTRLSKSGHRTGMNDPIAIAKAGVNGDNRADINLGGARSAACMAEDIILETRGLTKEFKGFVAVNGVDLHVKRGTIHALIGPNGAGKTTCFNLLTAFLTPSRGEIFYNGREITGARPAAIARMGMVRSFQISATFPHLTVLENVRIALQRKRGHSFGVSQSARTLNALDAPAQELLG